MQYFQDVVCPPDVRIPTEDFDAYEWNPAYRWVYNKLLVAESQGLLCAPHGVTPRNFPVFSKPIINLRGMGASSRTIASLADYERHETAGHFWMTLLVGEHVSSDIAITNGTAVWFRHAQGIPAGAGTFDYWTIRGRGRDPDSKRTAPPGLPAILRATPGWSNLETIGGRIIEVHLRFTDQWPDLYGAGWLPRSSALYATGEWLFDATIAAHRLQRCALRAARHRIPSSAQPSGWRSCSRPGRDQHSDHLSR